MNNSGNQDFPPDAGAVIATRFLDAMARQLPSSQEKQGDQKLDEARVMAAEYHHLISERDHRIIEERIVLAREMKVGLDSKTGFTRLIHAREYRKAAKGAYRYVEVVFPCGLSYPIPHSYRSAYRAEPETMPFFLLHRVHQNLALPDTFTDANSSAKMHFHRLLRRASGSHTSMILLSDMKTGMEHAVESLYGFNTSRAPDSISRNARDAQALLTSMSFVYREPNFGGNPRHPYRHPIIQKAINALWFQNKDSDGIIFYEYFAPIPIQAIALVLTVIECCIDEWTDGTRKNSSWNEERYKTVYHSHVKSLTDLRDYNHPQSVDLLEQMQRELLQNARAHAGAPPEPVTGSGRLHPRAINAALQEDLPEYDEHNTQIPTINISSAS
ncbi:hypothetical protein BC826DRAFT_1137173 [Russula brevipes]|nr:hypothetical protein BC826DRAFT_1137173 [Russula brevipes]